MTGIESIGISIISSLIVEGGKRFKQNINRNSFENAFNMALKETTKDFKTKQREQTRNVFKTKRFSELVYDFEQRGKLIQQSDLVEIFKSILGETASIFVQDFWAQMLHEIAQDEKLSHEYQLILEEDTNRLLRWQQEKESTLQSTGLRQIAPLPEDFVEPTTALVKVKTILGRKKACLVYGPPGSGKSVLAAAMVREREKQQPVFWLEFQPHQADAKLVQQEIVKFLEGQKIRGGNWLDMLQNADCLFVFDNLHYIHNDDVMNTLETMVRIIIASPTNRSRILFTSRKMHNQLAAPEVAAMPLLGLAEKEALTLLRVNWQLPLSDKWVKRILQTFASHPQFMRFFYEWQKLTRPTEEQIDNYLTNASSKQDRDLEDYLVFRLYDALGGADSNANNLLKAVAFWRLPESTEFIEQLYEQFGGTAFHDTLWELTRQRALVIHQTETDRYTVHDILRHFYYQRTDKRRQWHRLVAALYKERMEEEADLVSHLEAAHHYRKANLYEDSARAILPITHFCTTHGYFWAEIKRLMSKLPIADFGRDLQTQCWFALGGLCLNTGEWDKAIEFYNKSLEVFEKVGDIHGMAQTYNNLGLVYQDKGEWDKAIEFYNKSVEVFEKLGDFYGMGQTYNNLGLIYENKSEWEKSIKLFSKSLEMKRRVGNIHGIAQTYTALGLVYAAKGEWNKAIDFYINSIAIYEKVGDAHGMAQTYGNLGITFSQKSEWDKAIEFYNKAIEMKEKIGDIHGLAQTYGNMGIAYKYKGEWDKAIEFYNKALEGKQKTGDIHGMAQTYTALGLIYGAQGKWNKAIDLYNNSIEVYKKVGDLLGIARTWSNLAIIFSKKSEYNRAIELYTKSIEIFEKFDDLHGIAQVHGNLASVYMQKRDWELAIRFYNKSLAGKEKVGDIHGMGQTLANMAVLAMQQGDYFKAVSLFFRVQLIFSKLGARSEMEWTFEKIGQVAKQLGEEEFTKQMDKLFKKFQRQGVVLGSVILVSPEEVRDILKQMQK